MSRRLRPIQPAIHVGRWADSGERVPVYCAEGRRVMPPVGLSMIAKRFQRERGVIRWRMHLVSSPSAVYALLATNEGRAKFWAESAIERDGVIDFAFVNGMRANARILGQNPPDRFSIEYFGSTVVFELESDGKGGTDLTLTNTLFDPADREELVAGWLNVLFPLKAAADFEVDLRNHDPSRTWDDGYVDQ